MRRLLVLSFALILLSAHCLAGLSIQTKGQLHIVAIGISDYSVQSEYAVAFCRVDATSFADSLAVSGKWDFDKVSIHLLLDRQATRKNIADSVQRVINDARPSDTFVFFFAGFSRVGVTQELYLATSEVTSFEEGALRNEGLSGEVLRTWLEQIQARNQLVILDAGPASFETFRKYFDEEPAAAQRLTGRNIVMLAMHPYSTENRESGHGVLTQNLLSGLVTGSGSKGVLTAWGLETQASRTVYEWNQSRGTADFHLQRYIRGHDFVLGRSDTTARPKPQRGVIPESPDPEEVQAPAVKKPVHYALLFGSDTYDSWSALDNPVNDVRTIAGELRNSYGFVTEVLENPTQEIAWSKLEEYLNRRYDDNDQLLIMFAGHGDYKENVHEGYVVLKDSRAKRNDAARNSYISYANLRNTIDNIPCKHIVLTLDVCFGGTFDQRIARRGDEDDDPLISTAEFIKRKGQFRTRRFLTSGGKEYVPDGTPGRHSPFARRFIEALRTYGGKSGLLTLGKIWESVERVTPQPYAGEFGSNEPGSDFLFVAKKAP